MAKENNKLFVIKLASMLFAITFVATLLLTLCNYITKDRIELLQNQKQQEAKQSVLPGAEFEEVIFSDEEKESLAKFSFVSADTATKDNRVAGYCVSVAPQGFGGPINMIVGLDTNLELTGVKIISMAETPGLGAKAQDDEFCSQYTDSKTLPLVVVKNSPSPSVNEINALSGATITSKAVTDGVNYACEIAKFIQKEAE